MTSPRIVSVGAATWDLIFGVPAVPARPTKVLANRFVESCSGMATSAAIAIAKLGGDVRIASAIGTDLLGDRYIADLTARGVNVSAVARVASARTAISSIVVGGDGERLACPYYDPQLANAPHDDLRAAVGDCDAVLCDVRWPDAAEVALDSARERGILSVLSADVAPADVLERLVPLAEHVIFSHDGLTTYARDADPHSALRTVAEANWSEGCVGVTLGERGFLGYHRKRRLERPAPPPPAPIIDTLAAGDTFHGAFTLRLAETLKVSEAVNFALAAATLKCTQFGGNLGTPSREALETYRAQLSTDPG